MIIISNSRKKNIANIRLATPDCEIQEIAVNYVNYFDIIGRLSEIIKNEMQMPDTCIIINVGTGSKMIAIANMDAYRIWPEHMFVIYPYSSDYKPERPSPAHDGAMKAANLLISNSNHPLPRQFVHYK